jgi:hypothetical protein
MLEMYTKFIFIEHASIRPGSGYADKTFGGIAGRTLPLTFVLLRGAISSID